ncbi:hypothetical protein [Streptomyces ureilyticus]|uniref:Uncharacterized protein n=1 Tax=Streptomyces ureilyticus TaxID=1775131 RepID=A0ABX0DJA0_9ACTN|nr:hypothetical protein [Streptomyces ureilyticus]NGO41916.1 hypothetical protein [Streptomyces ureilyticus]
MSRLFGMEGAAQEQCVDEVVTGRRPITPCQGPGEAVEGGDLDVRDAVRAGGERRRSRGGAATSRQYLYRNWPDFQVLIQKACEAELDRLLDVASCTGGTPPQTSRLPAQIVRAARLLREHPVTTPA